MKKIKINPFTPTIGVTPEIFLGRVLVRNTFMNVINNPNSAYRTALITGVRGVGKTSLMRMVQADLEREGATTSFITADEELTNQILRSLTDIAKVNNTTTMKLAANVGLLSAEYSTTDSPQSYTDVYHDGKQSLDAIGAKKNWHVFFIDEAHAQVAAIVKFAKAYQQWLGDGYKVMLIMAGLADELDSVLNEESATFMRRAKRVPAVAIKNVDAIEKMYRIEFEEKEIDISYDQIHNLTMISAGYPYLVQLLGSYVWEYASQLESEALVEKAIKSARREMFTNVFQLLLKDQSAVDIEFLTAVAKTMVNGEAKSSWIQKEMDNNQSYVAQYRLRAIKAGLIAESRYGYVKFTMPMLDEYMKQRFIDHRLVDMDEDIQAD